MQKGIILLRPAVAARQDMMVCKELGWRPLLQSYQRLQPQSAALQLLAQQCRQAKVVFWSSPSTVQIAAGYAPKQAGQLHVAVGQATASALQAHGFTQVVCPADGQDSEAVWRLPLWHCRPGRVVLVGGCDGRPWLAERLAEAGWQVQRAEVYQRIPESLDWQAIMHFNERVAVKAVYMTTRQAVNSWFDQLPSDLHLFGKSLIYLTHHPRVAQALMQYEVQSVLAHQLRYGLTLLCPHSE